jgi:hypothetical protein
VPYPGAVVGVWGGAWATHRETPSGGFPVLSIACPHGAGEAGTVHGLAKRFRKCPGVLYYSHCVHNVRDL